MADTGFAIHCPHCQRWSYWSEHPREKVLDSVEELDQILKDLKNASLQGKKNDFYPPKLLRCKSPPGFCPASFEAFVCRGDEDPHKYSSIVESWSPKRHFRLYKADTHNLWDQANEDKYCGILFNTQQISRQRYIELKSLMDRELISRLIAGMCLEIDLPLTFFAANIFELNDENRSTKRYWMPIEGYSQKKKLVPPRFNLFCETCRNLSIKKLVEEFEDEGYGVNNCPAKPIKFGKDGKCMGKEAACIQEPKDWNHCPAFMEERKDRCPCYNSDLTLIGTVEDKWRNGEVSKEGISHICHAGFREVAFPIEVHGHLVGVAMTGQLFSDPNEIKHATDFINSKKVSGVEDLTWDALVGKEKDLEEARQILVGLELKKRKDGKSIFLVDKTWAKQKIERLLPNLERFEKAAESHYTDFRAKSESAFRQEILAYIRRFKKASNFFKKKPVLNVLKRMREFWAFKAVGFLCYLTKTKGLSVISYGCETEDSIEEKGFGFPGEKVGSINFAPKQEYPLGWFYDPNVPKTPQNPWITQFLPLFEDARNNPSISLPKEGCYFLVVVPFGDEIYVFVLIARDIARVSCLEGRKPGNVSELCQEFMLGTCIEVIHEFADVRALNEQRVQAWVKDLQELGRDIQEEITNEVSVSVDSLLEEVLEDSGLSDKSRENVLQAKTRYSNIIPIIEKRLKKKLEKLKHNT